MVGPLLTVNLFGKEVPARSADVKHSNAVLETTEQLAAVNAHGHTVRRHHFVLKPSKHKKQGKKQTKPVLP